MARVRVRALRAVRYRTVAYCRWAFLAWAAYIVYVAWLSPQRGKLPAFTADYKGSRFLLHGQPVQILSGAIHYFRVLPELWEDRLTTMRAAGLNTIETYVEWSSHEPEEGQFDFNGQQNLVDFLQIAYRLGFMVILRPGPYICAERDFGGLPYWLLRNGSSIRLRTSDERFLSFAKRFLIEVFQKVKPLLIGNGGPIIMVQVENEYASYNECDSKYMRSLRDLAWAELGDDVLLFTTDGAHLNSTCGQVPGTLATVDFGADAEPEKAFSWMLQSRGPLMNSELYAGWLDHWGEPHQTVDTAIIVDSIRKILKMGASFNLYMFHGGTSFGFKTGANTDSGFQPQTTSYDYDAPINEAGDITDKFKAIRDVIIEFFPDRAERQIPPQKKKMALGSLTLERVFGMKQLHELSTNHTVLSPYPLTFEQVGQAYGFVLYETQIPFKLPMNAVLQVNGIRDRGYVYMNNFQSFIGILSRKDEQLTANLTDADAQQTLSILVENQGRVNFREEMLDPKGIVGNATLDDQILTGWKVTPIDLDNALWTRDTAEIEKLRTGDADYDRGLAVYATDFPLPQDQPVHDSFLRLDAWTKGVVFLNGFNLGRYWTRVGPQRSLYVPAPLFRKGENLLVVVELEANQTSQHGPSSVEFVAEPWINATVGS